MSKVFWFFSALAAIFILGQWYVFSSVRRNLFQRYRPVSRKVAYATLILLGIFNLIGVNLAVNPDLLPPEGLVREIAAVLYFSYLGCILILCLFFLALGIVMRVLDAKNALETLMRTRLGKSDNVAQNQRGCFSHGPKPTRPEAGARNPLGCVDGQKGPGSTAECAAVDCEPGPDAHGVGMSMTRRKFLKWTTAAGIVAVSGSAAAGVAQGFGGLVIEEFDICDQRFNSMPRPVTWIQVTDFHFGLFFGGRELQGLVSRLNAIEGDAVFLTGDLFHSPMTRVDHVPPILRQLRPRRWGNFAVLGNHDFYTGEWLSVEAIKKSNVRLLRNEWLTFSEGTADIHLGGIDDPMDNWLWGIEFPQFSRFRKKAPRSPGVRVLLSHRPSVFPFAADAGMDLVFAGHTHGGQIIVPMPGKTTGVSVAQLVSHYTHGWYKSGNASMYLNRGAGLTFVPWRLNCPPEIAVFHLKPSVDGVDALKTQRTSSGQCVTHIRC